MAGGTWIDQNKVRPGIYINYKSAPASLSVMGERGVVAIARQLDWGEKGRFYTIEDPSDCAQLGYSITDDAMLFVRQILLGSNRTSGATKILVWSLSEISQSHAEGTSGSLTATAIENGESGNELTVEFVQDGANTKQVIKRNGTAIFTENNVSDYESCNGSTFVTFSYPEGYGATEITPGTVITLSGAKSVIAKASATIGNLTATALYDGTYGNRLSLAVTAGADSDFIVQILLDGQVVDSQTVTTISQLVATPYCTFSGTGSPSSQASPQKFTGGSNGAVAPTAYSDFMTALELEKFDVVIYDGTNVVTKGAYIDFVKRLSNKEGVKCQAVVSDATAPDTECVINVYPHSVTLTDGTELTPEQLTWWVGGASAGANVFESLTYAAYPDAATINPVLTSSQQEDAIEAGKFALIAQFDKIQVLTDINSFTTFVVEKGKAFRKNRVIRTVFGLCNDIYKTFAQYYIGAVHNDEEGRKSLKAEILNLMNRYQGNRALQNVEADDVSVNKGVDSDAVVIEIYCQPVDSIEKIYINITIS